MKTTAFFFYLALLTGYGQAQQAPKLENEFFVLHNAIRGDSTYKTFDE